MTADPEFTSREEFLAVLDAFAREHGREPSRLWLTPAQWARVEAWTNGPRRGPGKHRGTLGPVRIMTTAACRYRLA